VANDIELEITPRDRVGEYEVRVIRAASGGEPRESLNLDVPRILQKRRSLENAVLASAAHARSGPVPEAERPLRDAGQELFEGLFTGAVRETYRASVAVARERGAKLRVVLHLQAPELSALPWEAMWDPESRAYLCRKEPLVRHVPAPYTPDPLPVTPPMRILCLVASPRGLPPLDVGQEREHLAEALQSAIADGRIHLEWLVNGTWDALQDRLLTSTWHVLHFIGHGDYDPVLDQGRVALVREEDGRADWVEAGRLVDLLNEADPTPRLVVLNSCSSGQSGTQDALSGTAAALVHGGISAVAAMQFRISDPAAVAFPRGFYKALAAGKSVDAALSSGRIAILGRGESLEWVTPVLYMRGGASRLFTIGTAAHAPTGAALPLAPATARAQAATSPAAAPEARAPEPLPREVTEDPRYQRGQQAFRHSRWDEAIALLEPVHAEHPHTDIPELATARRKRDLAAWWAQVQTGTTGTAAALAVSRDVPGSGPPPPPPHSPPPPLPRDERPEGARAATPPPVPGAAHGGGSSTHGGGATGAGPPQPGGAGGAEPHPPPKFPAPPRTRRRGALIGALIVVLLLGVGGIWLLTSGGSDTTGPIISPSPTGPTVTTSAKPSETPSTKPPTAAALELWAYMRKEESQPLAPGTREERTARVWAKSGNTDGGTLRVTPGDGVQIVDAERVKDGDGPCRVEARGVTTCEFGQLRPDGVRDFTIVLIVPVGTAPGTTVTLTVAATTHDGIAAKSHTKGYSVEKAQECAVEVPDVRGMQYEKALTRLTEAGFTREPTTKWVESRTVEPGIVVQQSIAPNSSVACDTEIEITIASDRVISEPSPTSTLRIR